MKHTLFFANCLHKVTSETDDSSNPARPIYISYKLINKIQMTRHRVLTTRRHVDTELMERRFFLATHRPSFAGSVRIASVCIPGPSSGRTIYNGNGLIKSYLSVS